MGTPDDGVQERRRESRDRKESRAINLSLSRASYSSSSTYLLLVNRKRRTPAIEHTPLFHVMTLPRGRREAAWRDAGNSKRYEIKLTEPSSVLRPVQTGELFRETSKTFLNEKDFW